MPEKVYAIIIPIFDPRYPEEVINFAEALCSRSDCPLVVINDGCAEQYQTLFERLQNIKRCSVINHELNRGKGRALKSAFSYLLEQYPALAGAVTADCDGQHQIEDILQCVQTLRANPEHLIIGTRDFTSANVPWKNRWGNRIGSYLFKRCTGEFLIDTQSGLRGIPAAFMQILLNKPGERFEFETTMLLESINPHNGQIFPILTLPVNTVYTQDHSTHFRSWQDSLKILKILLAAGKNNR